MSARFGSALPRSIWRDGSSIRRVSIRCLGGSVEPCREARVVQPCFRVSCGYPLTQSFETPSPRSPS